jgi:alpha-1,6-mannosyltransferase
MPPMTALPARKSGPPLLWLAAMGLVLLLLAGITPRLYGRLGDNFFIVQAILWGVLVVAATRLAATCPQRHALMLILGVAVLLRLLLLPAPPLTSIDVYRYVWDGRIQGAGFNPFRYVPAAPELLHLRDAVIFPSVDRADYAVTIYPPAAQILFLLATSIHDSVLAVKAALVAFEAITVAALVALLRRLGQPVTRVVAYAWHPLAVWEIAGNGHIDGAMTAMMMLGVWLYALGRPLSAAAAAAIGMLFKPFAVLVLPALWRPWNWKLPLVVALVACAFYLPYLSAGRGILGFLPAYASEEGIDSGNAYWIVGVLRLLLGESGWWTALYIAVALAMLAALALRAGFRQDRPLAVTITDINAMLLAFAFLLSPNYPWYFLMLVPFVALTGSLPGWVLTIGGFALTDEVTWDPWIPFWIRDAGFNIAVLAAFLVAWHRARTQAIGYPGAPLA